ncbi:MAG: DUF927 domain-containing protein [Acholeplasmataceae bacterium]|nr:DUF927 domain-containing protein [Acholeplasmataceae bacterium]
MAYIMPDYSNYEMVAVFTDGQVTVGNLLQIKQVKVASHGDNQSYLVTLEESIASGVLRTFEINFTEFNNSQETAIQIFNRNGYLLSSFKYANHLRDYISQEIQEMIKLGQVDYYHTNLGFTKMSDGTDYFLLGDTTYNGRVSTFVDKKFNFVQGTAQDYSEFLSEQILPYFETRLALTIGLSSVVASDLKEHGDLGTMVFNFTGQSSTGKTTALQFLASLWGCPKISNFGIVRTFNATNNFLTHTFTGTNGVPIIVDDATSLGLKDLSTLIYNIAMGEDKGRMSPNIVVRDSKGSWSGLVAISSESSILDHSTITGGSIPRLLEFDNIPWTQSAQHAKSIKRSIAKSYGHIGPEFIYHYFNKSIEDLQTLFDTCEDELDHLISVRDQYSGRIVSKLAIIYMTAILVEEFFQYPEFSAAEIRDFLVNFEDQKVPVRSIEAQALDIIKTYIVRNQHRMAFKPNKSQPMELLSGGDFIGYRQFINNSIVEVTVISQVLANELMLHNISQWRNILKHLEKQPFVKKHGPNDKVSGKDNYLNVKAITFRFQRETSDHMIRWYFNEQGLTPDQKLELKKETALFTDTQQKNELKKKKTAVTDNKQKNEVKKEIASFSDEKQIDEIFEE